MYRNAIQPKVIIIATENDSTSSKLLFSVPPVPLLLLPTSSCHFVPSFSFALLLLVIIIFIIVVIITENPNRLINVE